MVDLSCYTIGWVCALHTEYVAARQFLDEEHKETERQQPCDDNNTYTLGTMGKHHVVIAVMPHGEYGTASAATVARDMIRSFPNLRIGLMVGIGGGAPSKLHDIRLGDVVVSSPHDGKGGVYQYDFGKTVQEKTFQQTGHLNQPPAALLTAISDLAARIEEDGHDFNEQIEVVLAQKTRLRRKYGQPDRESDQLYRSTCVHLAGGEENCAETCATRPDAMLSRRKRDEDEDNPTIHYGLIASANQLMKDADTRDALAKDIGVLCFEMEAAGLMNQFPFLVVRGVCDYADSHKNKQWQGYAAMTAAAYTKRLLTGVAPSRVARENKMGDILQKIEQTGHQIRMDTEHTRQVINEHIVDYQRQKIDKWLSSPDPSTNHNIAKDLRHEATGRWFLDGHQYKDWKAKHNTSLWLHGIPGCGKTILSSTIIEDVRKNAIPSASVVLFFYFDFNDSSKQSFDKMLCSLVSQLYQRCEPSRRHLDQLFSSCGEGKEQPSSRALNEVLHSMIHDAGSVTIVLDALDECNARKNFLDWLTLQKSGSVQFLLASRKEDDIETSLSKWIPPAAIVPIQRRPVDEDIRVVVRSRIAKDEDLQRWKGMPLVREEIETTLMAKADGMFRWAACQLDVLKDCRHLPSLRKALSSLPKDLDGTYSRILNNISETDKTDAIRVLQFLTFSERPLELDEAVDAIAVNLEERLAFQAQNRMPNPGEIARICSSLVKITTRSREKDYNARRQWHDAHENVVTELQLARFSVKEYLVSMRVADNFKASFKEPYARAEIMQVSITYLLAAASYTEHDNAQGDLALEQFSAQYWMDHAAVAEENGVEIWPCVGELFSRKDAYTYWLSNYDPDRPWEGRQSREVVQTPPNPLYYACLRGLSKSAKALLTQGVNVNAQGGLYSNALQAASQGGHTELVQLLLDKGADVNAQGGEYGNALHAASIGGHAKVVQLLLQHGAEATPDHNNMTPLHYTALHGYEEVAQVMLDAGVPVDLRVNRKRWLPIVEKGKRCWESRDCPDPPRSTHNLERGLTPLHYAALIGSVTMTRFFVDKGADPNATSEYDESPLHLAIKQELHGPNFEDHWSDPIYQVEGALDNIDLDDEEEYSIVQTFVDAARSSVLEILLCCIGMDFPAKNCRSPLHCVPYRNSLSTAGVLSRLLQSGFDVDARDASGRTALHLACSGSNVDAVKQLINFGASVHDTDHTGLNALHFAAYGGNEAIIELVLKCASEAGFETFANRKGYQGQNALHCLLQGRRFVELSAVRVLTENGVGVNDMTEKGECPMSVYLAENWLTRSRDKAKIVDHLFKLGADPSFMTVKGCRNLGHIAASADEVGRELLEVLAEHGVNFTARDGEGRTILHHCARNGSIEEENTVRFLCCILGLSGNARDKSGMTPLALATEKKLETNDQTFSERIGGLRPKFFSKNLRMLVEVVHNFS